MPSFGSFDTVKTKSLIRMGIIRIDMQKNKLVNSVKMQRRSIAEMLAVEKYDSARIRVENCIREDINIEGLEVLSLFLELLSGRMQLIAESKPVKVNGKTDPGSACPPELKESITSVLWASARLSDTVPQLLNIRKALEGKFGKEFTEMAINNSEFSVNQRLVERLSIYTPPNEKCIAYLTGIAREYNLEGYDENKLRDANNMVGSAAAAGGLIDSAKDAELSLQVPGSVRTPSGLFIPPINAPQDNIDQRLLRIHRS